MYARAEGHRVRIGLHLDEPEVYLQPLNELLDAQEAFVAVSPETPTALLRSFGERLEAAEADVDDVFSDVYTIEQAEALASRLFAAITEAKANDGRFGGDE